MLECVINKGNENVDALVEIKLLAGYKLWLFSKKFIVFE